MLLCILVLGLAGTGTELLLLQHYEDGWQLVPLFLIALALLTLLWHALTRDPASVRAIQAVMALFLVSGIAGVWFHRQANSEFELELDPSLAGLQLFKESMSGATPVLAPGTMIELGLIGLVYTYRHPRLSAANTTEVRIHEWDA